MSIKNTENTTALKILENSTNAWFVEPFLFCESYFQSILKVLSVHKFLPGCHKSTTFMLTGTLCKNWIVTINYIA